ncbi:MAG: hypothetical protein GY774_15820, partial [Planctomycetes bacterium]|nr:hypothetical protein [Planctomycetota bacterium]
PFAHYPSYILEVKPSPELKAEIERFGLAEIKWHTPYDYSLDRQVIRYDFGEPVDGDWTSYRSKRTIFEEVASQRNAEYINTIVDEYDYSSLILDGVRYPSAVAISENEVKCVISIPLKSKMEISDLKYVVEGGSRELPVLRLVSEEKATDLANVDVSSVFAYYHPESVSGYEQDKLVCSLYGGSLDYLYIAYKLLMPVLHRNVHSFLVEKRTDFSFGGNQLVVALRSL